MPILSTVFSRFIIKTMQWGDYFGGLTDKYGINWMINCPSEKGIAPNNSQLKNKACNIDNCLCYKLFF